MPEIYLRQRVFTYSACEHFTKSNERIQKLRETGHSKFIYRNELGKPCFQHGMVYRDFKDSPRRADSDKVLCDKEFNIAKNPINDGHQRRLTLLVYELFDKMSSSLAIKNQSMPNQELPKELH